MCCQHSTVDYIVQDFAVDYTVQDSSVDWTVQERKRKGPEMYFKAGTATDGTEPSDIIVFFPLLLL